MIVGFLLHGALHLEPATIAMTGATVLMLWGRNDPHHVLREIEWTTLFFFIGLFITVEAVVHVGIIETVAQAALRLTGGDLALTSLLLIWLSAIASGIVDNIPYTATMIPVVKSLGRYFNKKPPASTAQVAFLCYRVSLEPHHVGGLRAFGTALDGELHAVAFFQVAITFTLDRRIVDEHIVAAIALNEAVALRAVKPLHCALDSLGH